MLDVVFSLEQITWSHTQGMEPRLRRMCSLPSYWEGEPEAVSIPTRQTIIYIYDLDPVLP